MGSMIINDKIQDSINVLMNYFTDDLFYIGLEVGRITALLELERNSIEKENCKNPDFSKNMKTKEELLEIYKCIDDFFYNNPHLTQKEIEDFSDILKKLRAIIDVL